MATRDHDRAMMQLGLDNGANINDRIPIMSPYGDAKKLSEKKYIVGEHTYTYATPVLVFLYSIESSKSPNYSNPVEDDADKILDETAAWRRVDFNYTNGLLVFDYTRSAADPSPPRLYGCICTEAPTGIDILVDKWGLQRFAEPRFADTIKLLVYRGVSVGHVARLLLKYDRSVYSTAYRCVKEKPKTKFGRDALITILLEGPMVDSFDDVLATFVIGKARQYEHWPHTDSAYAIIERLIDAGANINARTLGGKTVGLRRCIASWLSKSFLPFLAEKDADPTKPVGAKGETALDALVNELLHPQYHVIPFLVAHVGLCCLEPRVPPDMMSFISVGTYPLLFSGAANVAGCAGEADPTRCVCRGHENQLKRMPRVRNKFGNVLQEAIRKRAVPLSSVRFERLIIRPL
ncbi:hypothetical protein F4779DRAFT_621764 [Xylariaceae sp. FL0662B]|nr:hypothetical protein F4779DRAFT_621764 [Xylariaceae sp. FL0662B]